MRHVFQDFIGRNITLYNEHQLEEIATDVGDKYLATMYRCRAAPVENRDKNVTEIEGDVYAFNDAAINFLNDAEQEGSVGEGEEHEVVSPKAPMHGVVNDDEDALYRRLAELEVEKLKMMMKLMKM
jgi:hypothetical protein